MTYDAYYFQHCCGLPYRRDAHWLGFFGRIADRIVGDIRPVTVLDAGCAMGFLVEALRDRGIDAWGIDISDYALSKVRDDVKAYCSQASVTEPLERQYDLIACIEVLEHLDAPLADAALENLCGHADAVLFSSSPSDYAEPTHVNVRQPDEWATRFAAHGFHPDAGFDAAPLTPWAALYRRDLPAAQAIAALERRRWQLAEENAQLRQALRERDATSRSAGRLRARFRR